MRLLLVRLSEVLPFLAPTLFLWRLVLLLLRTVPDNRFPVVLLVVVSGDQLRLESDSFQLIFDLLVPHVVEMLLFELLLDLASLVKPGTKVVFSVFSIALSIT